MKLTKDQTITLVANCVAYAEERKEETRAIGTARFSGKAVAFMEMRQYLEDVVGDILDAERDSSYYFI